MNKSYTSPSIRRGALCIQKNSWLLTFGFVGIVLVVLLSFSHLIKIAAQTQTAFINVGDTWKYFKGTADPDPAWKNISFDDSSWLSGPTGIGYGDGDDATVLNDMTGNYLTVYARKNFTVNDPATITALTLDVNYDDGFVAYLNGQEVARASMPSGTPTRNTTAVNHEAGSPENFDLSTAINLLTSGTNVLATEVHNQKLDSSDLSLIPAMIATVGTSPVPSCTENWQCGSWSICTNNQQTRTCTDLNNCGTITTRPALRQSCGRPYTDSSPWNTPIGANPTIHSKNDAYMAELQRDTASKLLTIDPSIYQFPVYYANNQTPLRDVTYTSGWFSNVIDNGETLINNRSTDPAKRVTQVPIPEGATPSSGYDSQIIIINTDTGDEWDLSFVSIDSSGNYHATNIGHYNVNWNGAAPHDSSGRPYYLRGDGSPYLTGLIRPHELKQGRIYHAPAFAYTAPSPEWVYPATKSDGNGVSGVDVPEGTRLQLDPTIDVTQLSGCNRECQIIARALQEYGMIVSDNSGSPKLRAEFGLDLAGTSVTGPTAYWGDTKYDHPPLTRNTVNAIPLDKFRVIESVDRSSPPPDTTPLDTTPPAAVTDLKTK